MKFKKGDIPWNKGIKGVMKLNKTSFKKGHVISEETKRKISKAAKGRIFTEEHKEKLKDKSPKGENHYMYGKKHTEESKQKNRIAHLGKIISEETRGKMSLAKSGKNHYNWKGGITCEPYCQQWTDKDYKENIKEYYNYQCQNPFCLCDSSDLVLHHINYIKKDCHWKNIIPICRSSNTKANTNKWLWQEIYENIQSENIL